jgi:hypothetical protein
MRAVHRSFTLTFTVPFAPARRIDTRARDVL